MENKILQALQEVEASTKRPASISYIDLSRKLGDCREAIKSLRDKGLIRYYPGINDYFIIRK
jgi:hypothetical protein